MKKWVSLLSLIVTLQSIFSIDLYFKGNVAGCFTNPAVSNPKQIITVQGGGLENDDALKYTVAKTISVNQNPANLQVGVGIDVIIVKGGDGNPYSDTWTDYAYNTIKGMQSVVYVVFASASEANNINNIQIGSTGVTLGQYIDNAEMVIIPGGNQAWYYERIYGTTTDTKLRAKLTTASFFGTSAGAMVVSDVYFLAQPPTAPSLTSSTALGNPYGSLVTLGGISGGYQPAKWFNLPPFNGCVIDTHIDTESRIGRTMVFMARGFVNGSIIPMKGIALEETVALVCEKDANNHWIGSVYGIVNKTYKTAYVWFMRATNPPETCTSGTPLKWIVNNQAISVQKMGGTTTQTGTSKFNLTTWSAVTTPAQNGYIYTTGNKRVTYVSPITAESR